ncbi:MAG: hypothetical protein WA081_02435 [Desulfosalsimonadaceae bacterium]
MPTDKLKLLKNSAFVIILIIAGLLPYASTLHAPFVFDDLNVIVKNNPNLHVKELSFHSLTEAVTTSDGKQRPLSLFTLAINYYYGGTNTFGYHLVNLFIHLLTGVLLFYFLTATLKISTKIICKKSANHAPLYTSLPAEWIAFLSALIWLLHPLQTNAVTYIVQRMTSLSAMFYVLSMLLYIKGRIQIRTGCPKSAAGFLAGAVLSGLCAIMSKETAAILPLFILLYEWFFFQDLRPISAKALFAGTALSFILVGILSHLFLGSHPMDRILADYDQWNFTMPERVMTEFRVIIYYFSLIFFPHPGRLMVDYDYPISHSFMDPPTTLISALLVAMLFFTAIVSAKKHRLFSFCLIWFLGNLMIESSVIGIEIIYEHRLYLPSMMICFFAVYFACHHIRQKWAIITMLLAITSILGVWTYQRNRVWASDIGFWEDCAQKSPNDARPIQNLAYTFQQRGDQNQAIQYYQKSLALDNNPITHYNIGISLSKMEHHLEAVTAYKKAIELNYRSPVVYSKIAYEQVMSGELNAAQDNYRLAVTIKPDNDKAQNALQKLSTFLQKCGEMVRCLKNLCKEFPQNPDLRFKLAGLLAGKGDIREAISRYREALALMPESKRPLYLLTLHHLADCNAMIGEKDNALDILLKYDRLSPGNPEIAFQLAAIQSDSGNTEAAFTWLGKAVHNGFCDWSSLEKDTRLDAVRHDPRFRKLITESTRTDAKE